MCQYRNNTRRRKTDSCDFVIMSHNTMQIWLSDQGWALASDAFYLPEPGSKLTPHSGCAQPPNCRARGTLSPRGWTCVLLINNCGTLLKAVTSWKILDEGEQHFSDLQKRKKHKKNNLPFFFSPKYAWTAETGGAPDKEGPLESQR